jgi:outer membrane protein OmpA-like peptidoglycan-associated protein
MKLKLLSPSSVGILYLGLLTLLPSTLLEASCPEGNRYLDLAKKSGGKQDFSQAVSWLERSVESCDSYDAWHLMGMAQQKQRNLKQALDAYSQAAELAPDEQSTAISIARYGQTLALNGQRYEALTMLERAMDMHPNPPSWIRDTAKQIDLNIVDQPISRESIKRSLSTQEFGLLASVRTKAKAGSSRIRIPINFEYDSIDLDSLTQKNLSQLGAVLSETKYQDKTFTLIGHTDIRGTTHYNLDLSESRAAAIEQELVKNYPALKGRLKIKGAGESSPKYKGQKISEDEHRLNRRLEVFIN